MKNNTDIITSYEHANDNLFKDWKNTQGSVNIKVRRINTEVFIDHKENVFIRDGVVCPKRWFSQKVRPLFLLKEAYGGKYDWDLIKGHLLKSYSIDKTWERISQWARGILNTDVENISPYIANDPEIRNFGNEQLKKIAVINIKKSRGTSSSNYDNIRAYAEFDKVRLLRQIELCDPTVIICGYTSSELEIITETQIRKSHNDNLFYHMSLNGHDVLVLDFWHPANHYPDIMNYYALMGIYQLALKEKP